MNQVSAVKSEAGVSRWYILAYLTPERLPWELYLLVGGIIVQTTLVLLGNHPYVAAWLLALLMIAVGQGLLLPSPASWLCGLIVLVIWVLFRQATDIWVPSLLRQCSLEVAGLVLNIVLAVRHHSLWQQQQRKLHELRELRDLLVAGEETSGLLPNKVAGLRLREEVDRAQLYQRPLGLLLVKVEPLLQGSAQQAEMRNITQAVARQLANASSVHDIPFRLNENYFGVILPERNPSQLYNDAEAIANALQGTTFLDDKDNLQPAMRYATVYFGLGTYQGEKGNIDLMSAAVNSLNISSQLGDRVEEHSPFYAMPAAPIDISAPAVSEEEV